MFFNMNMCQPKHWAALLLLPLVLISANLAASDSSQPLERQAQQAMQEYLQLQQQLQRIATDNSVHAERIKRILAETDPQFQRAHSALANTANVSQKEVRVNQLRALVKRLQNLHNDIAPAHSEDDSGFGEAAEKAAPAGSGFGEAAEKAAPAGSGFGEAAEKAAPASSGGFEVPPPAATTSGSGF
jgi:hypothetical protein